MPNLNWSDLTALQSGQYAEYYVKMEFTSYGFDVYTSEVDDHGIDFIVKDKRGKYYEVQVKSSRYAIKNGYSYVFAKKDKFDIMQNNLLLALVLLRDKECPKLYLIPATAWNKPNLLLKDKDYNGLKSAPEWGINLSNKNMCLLEPFTFDTSLMNLK